MTFTGKNVLRIGVTSLAMAMSFGPAVANQHPHPHKGSLETLDRDGYARNMRVLGVFHLGEERCSSSGTARSSGSPPTPDCMPSKPPRSASRSRGRCR
jgi:hypothetical protein